MNTINKIHFDIKSYNKRVQDDSCFICNLVSKKTGSFHHIIYEDDFSIIFLNKYPTLYGYVLVSPKKHLEQVTNEFSLDEYLYIQKLIYFVSESLRTVVNPERMYILSMGRQQGNRHVHWHIAPLPPNVPYEKQQFEAIKSENGILDLSFEEMEQLARKIKSKMIEKIKPEQNRS